MDTEATKWCYDHKAFAPLSAFAKNRYSKDGLQTQCRDCRKRYNPTWAASRRKARAARWGLEEGAHLNLSEYKRRIREARDKALWEKWWERHRRDSRRCAWCLDNLPLEAFTVIDRKEKVFSSKCKECCPPSPWCLCSRPKDRHESACDVCLWRDGDGPYEGDVIGALILMSGRATTSALLNEVALPDEREKGHVPRRIRTALNRLRSIGRVRFHHEDECEEAQYELVDRREVQTVQAG